jgi:hypothetical protein
MMILYRNNARQSAVESEKKKNRGKQNVAKLVANTSSSSMSFTANSLQPRIFFFF